MSFLETIVKAINENFEQVFTDKAFIKHKIYSITQPVKRTKENGFDIVPGVWVKGEFKYVGPDDDYNLIIYHKMYGDNESVLSNTSYGRSNGLIKNTADMSMVVFGLRDRLDLSQFELKHKIRINLIEKIEDVNLQSVNINAVSSVMDMQLVFGNEFKNIPYNLNEKHILFELKYKIETVYKKDCQPC